MRGRLTCALLTALSIVAGLLLAAPANAQIVPTLSISAHVCRGYNATVTGSSFPDGPYTLTSTSGTLTPTVVQAIGGQFSAQLKLPVDAPDSFVITASDQDTSEVTASLPVGISAPYLYKADDQTTIAPGAKLPVVEQIGAGCFQPNELVVLSGSAGVDAGGPVLARPGGWFYFNARYIPADLPTDSATVTATGASSGKSADLTVSIPGRTLPAGRLLAGDRLSGQLTSTSGSYTFVPALCAAPIIRLAGAYPVSWSARTFDPGSGPGPSGCNLSMQHDGNVVLRSPGGQVLWSTGTAGSGSDNRLVMQNSGALELLTPTGTVLWSSAVAPSSIAIASSRVRTAVYVNGLAEQRAPLAGLVRGAHRTAYLQRYLNGAWQSVLSRVTDSQGKLVVGFIQPKVFQYRWVLLAEPDAKGAVSASTFR